MNKKNQVKRIFDTIANKYDFLNHFLSAGIDFYWRKKALKLTKIYSSSVLLDVACGTGDFSIAAKKFRKELIEKCQNILNMPYKHRKSIYHDDENIRDLVFKGYTVIYIVEDESLSVFALIHHEKYNTHDK